MFSLNKTKEPGVHIYNLGTGKGTSVLELLNEFSSSNNIELKYDYVDKRDGDIESIYTDPEKAYVELGWKSKRTINDSCKDAWNFRMKNV